jgi:hypothetical protein
VITLIELFVYTPLILRESTAVPLSAGVGEVVWTNGLKSTLGWGGDLSGSLEVLLSRPVRRERRQCRRNLNSSHLVGDVVGCGVESVCDKDLGRDIKNSVVRAFDPCRASRTSRRKNALVVCLSDVDERFVSLLEVEHCHIVKYLL